MGAAQRDSSFPCWGGGQRPVQFGRCGAEPLCVLYGPVTQLSHHNSLGQGGLSSICHPAKRHCIKGRDATETAQPPTPLALLSSPRQLAPHLFHLSQNNRKTQENLWGYTWPEPGGWGNTRDITANPCTPKITFLSKKTCSPWANLAPGEGHTHKHSLELGAKSSLCHFLQREKLSLPVCSRKCSHVVQQTEVQFFLLVLEAYTIHLESFKNFATSAYVLKQ